MEFSKHIDIKELMLINEKIQSCISRDNPLNIKVNNSIINSQLSISIVITGDRNTLSLSTQVVIVKGDEIPIGVVRYNGLRSFIPEILKHVQSIPNNIFDFTTSQEFKDSIFIREKEKLMTLIPPLYSLEYTLSNFHTTRVYYLNSEDRKFIYQESLKSIEKDMRKSLNDSKPKPIWSEFSKLALTYLYRDLEPSLYESFEDISSANHKLIKLLSNVSSGRNG